MSRTLAEGILHRDPPEILRRDLAKILHRYLALVLHRSLRSRSRAGPAKVSCRYILQRTLSTGFLGNPAYTTCQEVLSRDAKFLELVWTNLAQTLFPQETSIGASEGFVCLKSMCKTPRPSIGTLRASATATFRTCVDHCWGLSPVQCPSWAWGLLTPPSLSGRTFQVSLIKPSSFDLPSAGNCGTRKGCDAVSKQEGPHVHLGSCCLRSGSRIWRWRSGRWPSRSTRRPVCLKIGIGPLCQMPPCQMPPRSWPNELQSMPR